MRIWVEVQLPEDAAVSMGRLTGDNRFPTPELEDIISLQFVVRQDLASKGRSAVVGADSAASPIPLG